MQRYIVKRLLQALVALFLMSIIVFFLSRITGDPIGLLLNPYSTTEDRIQMTHELGLDRSLPEQYGTFLLNVMKGDMGRSITGDRSPALKLVFMRLPASLELAFLAIIMTVFIGVPLGVLSAVKRGSIIDWVGRVLSLLGQSMPMFWLGIMLIYLFGVQLHLLPTAGYGGIRYTILPAFTLGWFTAAAVTRLTRSSILEVLGSEFVKLARIKGLSETIVTWKHVLRNSILPTLTFMGTIFIYMITGAVVVETVFAWPGIGRLAYDAVVNRDFPVVQAVVLVMTAMFIMANLLVDILYAYVDPRIRYTS
jgi:peptide/nickel transport system permease protein